MAIDAGSIISEVRIALEKLSGDISKVDSSVKTMGQKLDATTQTTAKTMETNMGKGFTNINLAGVAAFAGIGLAVKAAAKTFIDFEQSLANVASVAGATEEEFKLIEQAAIDAGESTRFTASQAADAMYYLASAGYDATQSTEALNGVLLLAGSTGSDLAFTAETMASALSQYNLEAADAERVSNVFAATIANSQATMDKLAVSFRYVGPLASAFGISIEETSGALAILYNNGFEASQAGTALRSALADLANASSPAVAKLQELGVSFEEINPQTHSFAEVIGVLSERVTDGSDIMAVFGDRAGPALIKLLQAGQAEIESYTEAVTGTNKAAEMYATQNDTLAGSIDRMKSAAESAAIQIGKELAPAFRGIVDFVTGLIKGFNSLPGPVKAGVGVFALLLTALTGLSVVIPLVSGLMGGLSIAIGAVTLTAGPILAIIAGVAALTAGVVALTSAFQKQELEKIKKDYGDLAKEFNLTEKELVKLVKAARSVGVTAKEFATLQKETGLATKELKAFLAAANKIGATKEEVLQLNKQYGTTAKEINKVNTQFKALQSSRAKGLLEEKDLIETVAKSQKLSTTEVAKILIASKDVSEEYKEQAQALLDMQQKESEIFINKANQSIEASGLLKKEEYILKYKKEQLEKEEKITAEKEAQDKLAKAVSDLYQGAYKDFYKIIDANKTEIEQLEEKIALYKKLSVPGDGETDYIEKRIVALKLLEEQLEELKKAEELDKLKENAAEIETIYQDLASSLFGIFEALNQSRLEQNERELQAALEAAGVQEETKLESLHKQLEAAKEAGDAERQLELENAIKREEITEEYARKEAQIKYEAAQAKWYNDWLGALVGTAKAVIDNGVITPTAIAAGIAGAVQTGIILANPPKAPGFETGGIVLGNSYHGDNIQANLNSGEMILNFDQQKKLFDFINTVQSKLGNQQAEYRAVLMVGSTEIKNAIFKIINDGSRNNEFSMNKQVLR